MQHRRSNDTNRLRTEGWMGHRSHDAQFAGDFCHLLQAIDSSNRYAYRCDNHRSCQDGCLYLIYRIKDGHEELIGTLSEDIEQCFFTLRSSKPTVTGRLDEALRAFSGQFVVLKEISRNERRVCHDVIVYRRRVGHVVRLSYPNGVVDADNIVTMISDSAQHRQQGYCRHSSAHPED